MDAAIRGTIESVLLLCLLSALALAIDKVLSIRDRLREQRSPRAIAPTEPVPPTNHCEDD